MAEPQTQPAAEIGVGAGAWAYLVRVVTGPGEAFAALTRRPAFLPPLVTIPLVNLAAVLVGLPKLKEIVVRQMGALPNVSPEQVEIGLRVMNITAPLTAVVAPLVIWLALAGLLTLIGMLAGGEAGFARVFSVTGYALVPLYVVGGLVKALITMATPAESLLYLQMSLALLLPRDQFGTLVYRVLSAFDLFTLWTLALVVLGWGAANRFSTRKSAGILVPLWLVMVLLLTFLTRNVRPPGA